MPHGSFSGDFPSDCPPSDAMLAEGIFFRLVNNEPPGVEDFLSHKEQKAPCSDPCLGCGLSIFKNIDHAIDTFCFFAEKHGIYGTNIGHLVAEICLSNSDGKLLPTPRRGNSHHTWWPFEDVNRVSVFRSIRERLRDALEN